MAGFIAWVRSIADAIGAPGLLIIAFLDSSFLSLPEANDLLLVHAALKEPLGQVLLSALMATLGSVAGCFAIYWLARRGGRALLQRRVRPERLARADRLFSRFGLLAIMVPALLPPPAPFKVFVLLAGVAGVPPMAFVSAVAAARGLRFFGIGLLTYWYGHLAIDFLKAHGRATAFALAGTVVLIAAAWAGRRWFVSRRALTSQRETR